MSKEKQIEIKSITYEEERLYFFVDQVSLAQKKYDRLYKTFKDAPYLSEGAQFLSDAGRELQFYKDVVEMFDKGYRKQSEGEWISNSEKFSNIYDSFYCSNCKNYTTERNPYRLGKYCSFCGARMKGGAEEWEVSL
jgi:hypothetical protein